MAFATSSWIRRLANNVTEASTQFCCLADGAAWTELRGNAVPPDPERFWRNAFHALITGVATPSLSRRHT